MKHFWDLSHRLIFINECFIKKLDDGQSPKKEVYVKRHCGQEPEVKVNNKE
jgi:hypothetical protein